MQLVTIACAGFMGYLVISNGVTDQFAWSSFGLLSQDQANLVIVSDTKTQYLKYIELAARLTPILVLLGVFRIFGRLASRPFRVDKAAQVVRFTGYMAVLTALLDFAAQPAKVYAMTYDNPPGERVLAVDVNPDHFTFLLLGLALIIGGSLIVSAVRSGGLEGAYDDAEEEYEEAEEEYEEAEEELAEAEQELEAAEAELAEAREDLDRAETPEEIEEALEEMAEAEADVREAQEEVAEAREELAEAAEELQEAEAELAEAAADLEAESKNTP